MTEGGQDGLGEPERAYHSEPEYYEPVDGYPSSIWRADFWRATGERAVKTFCQTLGAMLIADGTHLLDTTWVLNLSVSGMACLISVLTSVGSGVVTRNHSPSFVNTEVIVAKRAKLS